MTSKWTYRASQIDKYIDGYGHTCWDSDGYRNGYGKTYRDRDINRYGEMYRYGYRKGYTK